MCKQYKVKDTPVQVERVTLLLHLLNMVPERLPSYTNMRALAFNYSVHAWVCKLLGLCSPGPLVQLRFRMSIMPHKMANKKPGLHEMSYILVASLLCRNLCTLGSCNN
jgi:hypothetical protein